MKSQKSDRRTKEWIVHCTMRQTNADRKEKNRARIDKAGGKEEQSGLLI